jgi:hypothetical protein
MSSHLVDKLVMELELLLGEFRQQTKEAERESDRVRGSLERTRREAEQTSSSLASAASSIRKIFAAVSSIILERLATNIAKVNDQLYFMQQRLGQSARSITLMSNAAAALGGDAAAMQNTMKGLNQSIQQLVIMGDASALPFFNALGVGVTDAHGKVRDMNAIMLDMAESFSRMDRRQGYALASAMGIDDDTAKALMQGREAMQAMIDAQSVLYTSTQQELAASRELRRQQALLGAYWDGIKLMLGNAIVPLLLKVTQGAQRFVDYLMRNERAVKRFFEGLAYVVGALTVAAFAKAALAAVALLAPFAPLIAAVTLLSAGFLLLYDDYKTWAEGGKSLFDWEAFQAYIDGTELSVDNLANGFVRLLTGYNSWEEALGAFRKWLELKGFLDNGKLSVDSLAEGFRNLGRDMLESMPVLQAIISAMSKIASGDISGALSDLASIPKAAFKNAAGLLGGAVEHVAGAVDTSMGQDPSKGGTLSGIVRGVRDAVGGFFGGGGSDATSGDIEAMLAAQDKKYGWPEGLAKAVWMQETSGRKEFIDNPAKYHYEKNEEGKRIAPHTGKVSTAFGPFGILESTARDPGYGVTPLQNKSLEEQIRFAFEYLAALEKEAGSLAGGLGRYGEGSGYAKKVEKRLEEVQTTKAPAVKESARAEVVERKNAPAPAPVPTTKPEPRESFNLLRYLSDLTKITQPKDQTSNEARNFTRGASVSAGSRQNVTEVRNDTKVDIHQLNVHTTAATLPAITTEALGTAMDKSANMLNQTASGL